MRKIETIFKKMYPIVKLSLRELIDNNGNIPKTGRKPKFSDLNVITLCLSAEFLSIDSENRLFDLISNSRFFLDLSLVNRSSFTRRRRKLYPYMNKVLTYLANQLAPDEDTLIVDSLPVEVCRFARANRAKICKDSFETAPDFGYCASQKMPFYGYKLHALCGIGGVFKNVDLSKGSIADIHYLQDVRTFLNDCTIIGDKGYLSSSLQQDLFQTNRIRLYTPKRTNQANHQKYPPVFRRLRKRIETLFSQLSDQFMIKRNYAKSFTGLATRILSKIVSLTVAQYFNKFVNHKPINEIKYAFSY